MIKQYFFILYCFIQINFIKYILNKTNSPKELKLEMISTCNEPLHKHYPLITMGYITPWKKYGYKIIEKYYNKFDIISPTWFELKPEYINNEFQMSIDGGDTVDIDYLSLIKSYNNKLKIVPRFHCSNIQFNDLINWFSEKNTEKFLKILNRRLKYNNFDGITLDCIILWNNEKIYEYFINFLKKISEDLHNNNKIIIISLFPYTEGVQMNNIVNKKKFIELSKYIDYFNIMTYDYISYHNRKNKNDKDDYYQAPFTWIKDSIEFYVDLNDNENKEKLLKKILLGLPFHGYVFNKNKREDSGVLDSNKFNDILDKKGINIKWDTIENEYKINLKNNEDEIVAVYPTREFLKKRLDYSIEQKLGGVAIWDVGNGNEGFLNEF